MENSQQKIIQTTPSFSLKNDENECKIIPFPTEHENHGAIPNLIIRSNLFGISKRNFKFEERKLLITQGDKQIFFRGQELNQTDLDIWLVIKKAFIEKPEGYEANFCTKEILKSLGMHHSKNNRVWLQKKIEKLSTSLLIFEHAGYGAKNILLVKDVVWVDDYNEFNLKIDSNLINLFESKNYTFLSLKSRRDLKSNLAKWLFNYWSSHKKHYAISIKKISELCGSNMKRSRDFKQILIEALNQLQEVGFISHYEIDKKNLVHIKMNNGAPKYYSNETHPLPLQ